jgi:hypothetical protein
MNRLCLFVVCGLGLTLTGCQDAMLAMRAIAQEAEADALVNEMSGPEASSWLKKNKNESALASNRFGPTHKALGFVNELYLAGADNVIVPDDFIDDDEFGPYADSLVVVLPKDEAKRKRVRAICIREIRREGFDPDEDDGSDRVFLWWD